MGINTLVIANRLKEAEREGRTAEEIALVLQEIQDSQLEQVATKEFLRGEIERLRGELRAEVAEVRAELKADIAELRAELKAEAADIRAEMGKTELRIMHNMTIRFGVMLAAAVALLGGLNIFF